MSCSGIGGHIPYTLTTYLGGSRAFGSGSHHCAVRSPLGSCRTASEKSSGQRYLAVYCRAQSRYAKRGQLWCPTCPNRHPNWLRPTTLVPSPYFTSYGRRRRLYWSPPSCSTSYVYCSRCRELRGRRVRVVKGMSRTLPNMASAVFRDSGSYVRLS